jgi:hypothetical protein
MKLGWPENCVISANHSILSAAMACLAKQWLKEIEIFVEMAIREIRLMSISINVDS